MPEVSQPSSRGGRLIVGRRRDEDHRCAVRLPELNESPPVLGAALRRRLAGLPPGVGFGHDPTIVDPDSWLASAAEVPVDLADTPAAHHTAPVAPRSDTREIRDSTQPS